MKKYIYGTLFFACLAMCFADIASAQPGLQGSDGGRAGDRSRAQEMMNLLRNDNVKKELELVEDQVEEINTIMEEMWTEVRESMAELRGKRDLTPEERRTRYSEMREVMNERREKYYEKINDVLLPNQQSRWKQLGVQSRSRRHNQNGGSIAVLMNSRFLDELGIDKETQEKLKKKTEEVLEELKKKVAKLRKEAEKEILSVLPSEAREKFLEAVGDSFDFSGGRSKLGAVQANARGGRRGQQEQATDK